MHQASGVARVATLKVVTAPGFVLPSAGCAARTRTAAARFTSVSAIHTGNRAATASSRSPNAGSTTIPTM